MWDKYHTFEWSQQKIANLYNTAQSTVSDILKRVKVSDEPH
jgi:predicted DNA-binding protein YlxM (UPF0122 family)